MAQTSRQLVSEFIERCDRHDDPYALLSENVLVVVAGTTPLSGQFPNLAIVRHVLVSTAKDRLAWLNVSIIEFIGTGERLAALLCMTGETVDSCIYNSEAKTCGCVFGITAGKIGEIRLYPDTTLIESLLYHRTFVPNTDETGSA